MGYTLERIDQIIIKFKFDGVFSAGDALQHTTQISSVFEELERL